MRLQIVRSTLLGVPNQLPQKIENPNNLSVLDRQCPQFLYRGRGITKCLESSIGFFLFLFCSVLESCKLSDKGGEALLDEHVVEGRELLFQLSINLVVHRHQEFGR